MNSNGKQKMKLIDKDANSSGKRPAKKRTERMKSVEEFKEAYNDLAQRYDHATGVIRHAQQIMADAFPNQDHIIFYEESLVDSSTDEFDPETPENYPPIRAPLYPSESQKDVLGTSESEPASKDETEIADSEDRISLSRKEVGEENERTSEAEAESLALKQSLLISKTDKEAALVQDRQCLQTIDNQPAEEPEGEVENFKKMISKLIGENEAFKTQHQQCLDTITDLELKLIRAQDENHRLSRETEDGVAKTSYSKRRILLRDYFYGGDRSERLKRVKKWFASCGCVHPLSSP